MLAIKLLEIPFGGPDEAKCAPAQITSLRGAVGVTLLFYAPRVVLADVAPLQQRASSAKIIHLKMVSAIVRRARKFALPGLIFLKIAPPDRTVAITDARHASSNKPFAIEGQMTINMSDKVYGPHYMRKRSSRVE